VVLDVESSLQDTGLEFALIDLPWVNPDGPAVEQYTINNESVGGLNAELVNWNLGFSFSLGSDFSIGGTATYAELDMESSLTNLAQDPLGLLGTENPRVDENDDGLLDDVLTQSTIDDSDSGFGWTLGLHFHPDSKFDTGYSPIRFGLVYHKGAELGVNQTVVVDPGTTASEKTFINTLRVPDRYGIGVSGELGRGWVFALDLERVEYSDLMDGFLSGVNFFTSGLIDDTLLQIDPDEEVLFDVDDATVVHVGAEYNLITKGRWTYGFRAGYFNAPDNKIRMTQFNSTSDEINEAYLQAFAGGESEDHFTAGFSFTTPVGLQFQFAGDFSDTAQQFVVSAIWRIGKVRR